MTKARRPPLLLIHGAFSHARHFAPWIKFFSDAGFRCHAPALPGHGTDDDPMLDMLGFDDYRSALQREVETLSEPPIIIGHSMGGLLGQQLATTTPCRALICVASAPPWILTAQFRALPYLLPLAPGILMGRAISAPWSTLRKIVLHDLAPDEQAELLPSFGPESGRAYRAMMLGQATISARPEIPVLCLSGGRDRVISPRVSQLTAQILRARHEVFPSRGHWLIARSGTTEVAGRIVRWIDATLGPK